MARSLNNGDQVLFLVPEISLTTQLSDRLKKVFGSRLLVYHSKFSDSERVDIWKRLLSTNEPLVVLGVRSSVFLPFARLGLVIVDEEHEASFKQYDPAPRYNARDAALVLAQMHGAKSLLGSATPSVETFYKAGCGKYGLVSLSERFEGATLPDVEIIDMKEMRKKERSERDSVSSSSQTHPRHIARRETGHNVPESPRIRPRGGVRPMRMVAKMRKLRRLSCLPQKLRAAPLPLLRLFSNSSPALPCVRTEWNPNFRIWHRENCGRASSGI